MNRGARIRFKDDLIEDATGDHPRFLMAKKGQLGTFIREDAKAAGIYTCLVKWDGFDEPFWASKSEFEELT